MGQTIFLAGATGAIGKRLLPLLLDAGYKVFGTTRSEERASQLSAMGAIPVVVDVYDAPALARALREASPQIVVNQLTDLPFGLDPALMPEGRIRNARIRELGSRHLVAAALAAGVQQLISQSIAWVYAPGPEPHTEKDALDASATSVRSLEHLTLESPQLHGIVLRYGLFYGPGTGLDRPEDNSIIVHIDAASLAALLAIERASPGIYNIVEGEKIVSSKKARHELGWDPGFRLALRH
jgi:nucleoside-diphosphate-sugar epimerase